MQSWKELVDMIPDANALPSSCYGDPAHEPLRQLVEKLHLLISDKELYISAPAPNPTTDSNDPDNQRLLQVFWDRGYAAQVIVRGWTSRLVCQTPGHECVASFFPRYVVCVAKTGDRLPSPAPKPY